MRGLGQKHEEGGRMLCASAACATARPTVLCVLRGSCLLSDRHELWLAGWEGREWGQRTDATAVAVECVWCPPISELVAVVSGGERFQRGC